jgi:hypothetical protein
VQFCVDRETCVKYGDRAVKFCSTVWIGKSALNMGIGPLELCNTVWIEESALNMGIGLYSCAIHCG